MSPIDTALRFLAALCPWRSWVQQKATKSTKGDPLRTTKALSRLLLVANLACLCTTSVRAAELIEADICVYGGTAAGVAAAVQAARMGTKAVIAEFGRHLGGMTSGGLGATDIGNKGAIGGIAREFYHRIAQHYNRDEAWRLERPEDYFKGSHRSAYHAQFEFGGGYYVDL